MWKLLEKRCLKKCDDQEVLNLFYYENGIEFFDAEIGRKEKSLKSGLRFSEGHGIGVVNVVADLKAIQKVDDSTKLQIMIVSEKNILRGGNVNDCDKSWIVHPRTRKDGSEKLKMIENRTQLCPIKT